MKKLLLLITGIFCLSSVFGQNDLPKGFAPEEWDKMGEFLDHYQNNPFPSSSVNSPDSPIRSMAEWEELQAIVVTWYDASYFYPQTMAAIIDHAQQECDVIVVCLNESQAISQIESYGVTLSGNVKFIEDDFNTVWHRDYGGNPGYTNQIDSLVYIDWIYNRPRPKDDVLPEKVADYLNIPFYTTTEEPNAMVNTGGNFMSDGLGTGFSSRLVLNENSFGNPYGVEPKSGAELDTIMKKFMGIDRYIKMEILPYDGIHHIDMHMKLLDEETLMVGEFPAGVSDGPQIEANIQYVLDDFKSAFGTDFKVVRIPQPPCGNGSYPPYCNANAEYRTYTNALFVNKTILVPTYDTPLDGEALDIWEENMPGYNIVGINCESIINAGGAIHCVTKEVGVDDPLWIVHQQVDTTCSGIPTAINATIKHKDGISDAELFYSTDLNAGYESVEMTDDGNANWTAAIPEFEDGETVYYYVHAVANSGKEISRPITAPQGYWEMVVSDCIVSNLETTPLQTVQLNKVYPNPASAITAIPVESSSSIEGTISLKDILGRTLEVIHSGTIPAGASNYFIHANQYEPGTYFIHMATETGAQTQSLIIR